jgi:GT2 family glycosyltransferase
MPSTFKISVIITTRHRPVLLEKCLTSLRRSIEVPELLNSASFEILVCVNGDDEHSLRLITNHAAATRDVRFEIVKLEAAVSPAAARNKMVTHAIGPANARHWLYFIDDDAYVDPLFFVRFIAAATEIPEASVFGGPNLTPEESNLFQRASGAALSSKFGAFFSYRRYAARSNEPGPCGDEALILCSLFVRKDALSTLRFPEHFVCNEENWLLQELQKRKQLMIYAPQLFVRHERRARVGAFAKQVHRYGIGRGQNLRSRPTSARPAHLIPAGSVAFTTLMILLLPWSQRLVPAWFLLFALYALLLTAASVRLGRRAAEPKRVRLIGALLFPLIHVSYGTGVLRGLVAASE